MVTRFNGSDSSANIVVIPSIPVVRYLKALRCKIVAPIHNDVNTCQYNTIYVRGCFHYPFYSQKYVILLEAISLNLILFLLFEIIIIANMILKKYEFACVHTHCLKIILRNFNARCQKT